MRRFYWWLTVGAIFFAFSLVRVNYASPAFPDYEKAVHQTLLYCAGVGSALAFYPWSKERSR